MMEWGYCIYKKRETELGNLLKQLKWKTYTKIDLGTIVQQEDKISERFINQYSR